MDASAASPAPLHRQPTHHSGGLITGAAARRRTTGVRPHKMEFRYFTVMAKGLGPVLALQFSGLEWKGNKDTGFDASKHWGELKKSGKCPFGQLPLLETEEGLAFSQVGLLCSLMFFAVYTHLLPRLPFSMCRPRPF